MLWRSARQFLSQIYFAICKQQREKLPAYVTHFRGANALVTGGTGFIGSNIVDALLAAGAHVRVLDDLSTGDRRNLWGARIQLDATKKGNTSDRNIHGDQSAVAAPHIDTAKQRGAELIVGSVNDTAAA